MKKLKTFWRWIKKRWYLPLLLLLAIGAAVYFVFIRGKKDHVIHVISADQMVAVDGKTGSVLDVLADIKATAKDIYDNYLIEGYDGTMEDDIKPYNDLYAVVGDLLKSIENYQHNAGSYPEKKEESMRENVLVNAEDFLRLLDTHTGLEGYGIMAAQRAALATQVTALKGI